jgi:glyoxylase-like metal-dependent hydrolase (beta-lactamase superfamily II)
VSFKHELDLISGDTLFPGGPGHTTSPANLRRELESIREKILPLPDETRVYPGHGEATTLGAERPAIEGFLKRGDYGNLCGDITWQEV